MHSLCLAGETHCCHADRKGEVGKVWQGPYELEEPDEEEVAGWRSPLYEHRTEL